MKQGALMLDLPGLWLEAEDRQLLRQPEVAGLILFARNTESPRQVAELVRAIRKERPDMLIAIDQEGGRVQRLRRDISGCPRWLTSLRWMTRRLTRWPGLLPG